MRAETGLRTTRAGLDSTQSADLRGLQRVLEGAGVSLQPLFGASEERVRSSMMALSDAADVPASTPFHPNLTGVVAYDRVVGCSVWGNSTSAATIGAFHCLNPFVQILSVN